MERLYKFLLTIVVIFVLTFTGYKFTMSLLSDMIETKAIETSLSVSDIEKEQLEAIKNTLDETEKNIIGKLLFRGSCQCTRSRLRDACLNTIG